VRRVEKLDAHFAGDVLNARLTPPAAFLQIASSLAFALAEIVFCERTACSQLATACCALAGGIAVCW